MKLLHEANDVHDIDFLPSHYHDEYARRKSKAWRLLIIIALAACLPTASLYQHRIKLSVQQELYRTGQQHAESQADSARRVTVQAELADASARAELLTYLRHPWPHTQVLAALVKPVPASMTFEQLTLTREASTGASESFGDEQRDEQTQLPDQLAAQDLERLRRETSGRVLVRLVGLTTDIKQLHRYLATLNDHPLFAQVNLESVESESIEGGYGMTARFEALLSVRPAYGQPGGPAGAPSNLATDTSQHDEASDRS